MKVTSHYSFYLQCRMSLYINKPSIALLLYLQLSDMSGVVNMVCHYRYVVAVILAHPTNKQGLRPSFLYLKTNINVLSYFSDIYGYIFMDADSKKQEVLAGIGITNTGNIIMFIIYCNIKVLVYFAYYFLYPFKIYSLNKQPTESLRASCARRCTMNI